MNFWGCTDQNPVLKELEWVEYYSSVSLSDTFDLDCLLQQKGKSRHFNVYSMMFLIYAQWAKNGEKYCNE